MLQAHLVLLLASNLFPFLVSGGSMNLGGLILLFHIWQRYLFKAIKLQQNKHKQLPSADLILSSQKNKTPVQKFEEFASIQQLSHPTASLSLELQPLIEFF